MAGQLDSLLKSVAKDIVATLGDSLDTTITYTKKGVSSYNVETGENITVDTTYSDLKVPIEFIKSTETDGRERREAKIFIAPTLIGNNQPTFNDEITITYAGSTRVGQIINIDTRVGLFTLLVRF